MFTPLALPLVTAAFWLGILIATPFMSLSPQPHGLGVSSPEEYCVRSADSALDSALFNQRPEVSLPDA